MAIGLGTGSTVAHVIQRLGELVHGGLNIVAVPTSYQTEMLAIRAGIPLTSLWAHPSLDIAIDGADQVDPKLNLVKGRGAAHTREKIVAYSATRFVIAVDEGKIVDILNCPVPLEVMPYARKLVEFQVAKLDGTPRLRLAQKKDGPIITDNGNFIIDADFGEILDPQKLGEELSSIPGILEHGIFTNVDEVHVGGRGGLRVLKR
ncbi:MAG: ribose 5-phosphate isomerase A [Methanocellales archaeon]|nr:ribose 5-phosphate isomerase A [Methanocellales archaeon]